MKATYVTLGLFVVMLLLLFLLVAGNNKARAANTDRYYLGENFVDTPVQPKSVAAQSPVKPEAASSGVGNFAPSDPQGNESYNPVSGGAPMQNNGSCFPRDKLSADDLLPKDAANSKWAQMNPAGQGDIRDQNFLTAGWHVGVNTVGQSLRNANYQLRSEPANPQLPVSPWNMSTIEPDMNRRPLEIQGDF